MRRITRVLSIAILVLIVALATVWTALALWYRFPAPELGRGVAAGLFPLLGAATTIALFGRLRLRWLAAFIVAFGAVLVWWSRIRPLEHADWAPEVARQVTGTRNGDVLTLTDVRNFEWLGVNDFTERWTTRTYDLAEAPDARPLHVLLGRTGNGSCHHELRLRRW